MSNTSDDLHNDAERIAEMADAGEDISRFFANQPRVRQPLDLQRINVDFPAAMLKELDRAADEMNLSRQALIKTLVRQSLDRHYLARAHQPR